MSFNLENLKLTKTTKREDLSNFGKVIYQNALLTDNIRQALWIYTKFRLFRLRHHTFTPSYFAAMINDLLTFVIQKNIRDITLMDVIINENQIIFEIANSIFYHSTKCLYKSADLTSKIENRMKKAPKPILNNKRMNNQELEDYFRSIMI